MNRGPTASLKHQETWGVEECARRVGDPIVFLPFQRRFLKRSLSIDVSISALSIPRGGGKSLLASRLLDEALPGGRLYVPGAESILLSGSMNQSRAVFRFLRALYPCPQHTERKCLSCELRWTDSYQRISVTHWPTDTRIVVRGKSGKLALGLANCPIIVGDEPAAWDTAGGQEMYDALVTSAGKTRQLLCLVGTLAPGAEDGWWRALIAAGSRPGVYVQTLQANPDKALSWREVLRVNPVSQVNATLRVALRREFDEAKHDSRSRAIFNSYRLNLPSAETSTVVLSVAEWKGALDRPVPPRAGRPVVGVDLGGGRAWSAAVALWPNGRTEAMAIAPGSVAIEGQEKRDRVPRGTYARLVDEKVLTTDGARAVPRVSSLIQKVMAWRPSLIACDRFRLAELQDAVRGRCIVQPRIQRWSEAGEDLRACQRLAVDGPLSVEPATRLLLTAALAASKVQHDDAGNQRLVKKFRDNSGRDDAAAALVLACGAHTRRRRGATGITRSMICEAVG